MPIGRYQDENYGSLIRIEYIAFWKIATFILTSSGKISAVNLQISPPYDWELLYCSTDTMGHQQTQSNDDNGESWQQQVSGFVPADEDDIETALRLLNNQRYVLKITRPNGIIKIVGSPGEPLSFKLDSNSQLQVPGTAGTSVLFAAITSSRALTMTA